MGSSNGKKLVAEKRSYLVTTVAQAKEITINWLNDLELAKVVGLGLPEVDDRYHLWRVPLLKNKTKTKIGELVIDSFTTEILSDKTTKPEMLEARLLGKDEEKVNRKSQLKIEYPISNLRNTIGMGDCCQLIDDMPAQSVDLVFTSPPILMQDQSIVIMKSMTNTCLK